MKSDECRQPDGSHSAAATTPSAADSTAGGIFDGGFRTYKTATEDDYRSLFDSGLIVLDTNTLLNMYRYQIDTRSALLNILTRLRERLWVPHHAMFEFFENRLSVIESRSEEAEKVIDNLHKKSQDLETAVRQWAKRAGLPEGKTENLTNPIRATVNNIAKEIEKNGSEGSLKQAEDTAKDPVLVSLEKVLQGAVGEPLPSDELIFAKNEAKQRISDKRPPGWRDASKRENPEGDYLIWHETLREAKERNSDVLFITGDVKADWWRKENGEAKGPLPELVHEMHVVANVRLFMLRPESLLVHAGNILGIHIKNDTIKEAKRVTDEPIQHYLYVEENTGRRYQRNDITSPGSRPELSYEWNGVLPPPGRHWRFSKENMDRMNADGLIEFTSSGRPVRKRYLDEQPGPKPPG